VTLLYGAANPGFRVRAFLATYVRKGLEADNACIGPRLI
jgi:hypothetical protein